MSTHLEEPFVTDITAGSVLPPDPRDDTKNARERLMAAAIESFASKGFHGTTTRDIATAAGLSPAAMYVHHRTKQDLLYVISKSGHQLTLDEARASIASSTDPVEQLVALVHQFVLMHARRHTLARVVNYELAALSAPHLAEIMTIRRAIEAEFITVLGNGAAAGVFSISEVHMTTHALLSMGIDTARWFRDDGRWSAEQVAALYSEVALRIVGATRGASCG
jgi:AcrR family transcriptional regulator